MPFVAPSYIAKLHVEPPESIPIHEFLFGDATGSKYGRHPIAESRSPFTCGITGRSHTTDQVIQRIDYLARALSSELGMEVNSGGEMDKVVGIFSVNTIDTMTVSWATHRLSGVSAPISPAYTVPELTRQLKAVKSKALFTCAPLAAMALEAAAAVGMDKKHVYLLEVPEKALKGATVPTELKTVDQLIEEGKSMEPLPELKWTEGQGARQTAFLCSSSGTSGLPKNVQVSHKNIIANVLQLCAFESNHKKCGTDSDLAVLPLSHSYALIATGHAGVYRGNEFVVLPGFDLQDVLEVVQTYKLHTLWMVPPMIVAMIRATPITEQFDLSSVRTVVVGASNLTKEVTQQFGNLLPNCKLLQGYGLTEAAVVVSIQNHGDLMFGSCGQILPGYEIRLLDTDGKDIDGHDTPGELLLRSPTVMIGYLDNEEATKGTFTEDGWLRTGDLMEVRKSEKGYEHLFIVDRVKELIKVRGMQVSPTEIEALLSLHPSVSDSSVVPITHDSAGELPIAFIVRSAPGKEEDEAALREKLHTYVDAELAEFKRLAGGIRFVDALPKSASGKTKRGEMKAMAREIYEEGKRRGPTVIQTFEFDSDEDDDED